jgi:hypothetical protein
MSRLTASICVIFLIALSCAFHVSPAKAEDAPKPKPPEKTEFVSGKITKVSARSITIREHKQFADELTVLNMDDTTTILLPPPEGSTGVNRKPHDGKVADLKQGDIVSASYKKEAMVAIKISVAEPPTPRKK